MVGDVITQSRATLADLQPGCVEDLRHAGAPVIRFSTALWIDLQAIRRFLFTRMYRRAVGQRDAGAGAWRGQRSFPFYLEAPQHLPEEWRSDVARAADETTLARLVADYIAGMTDRFAMQSHARLIHGQSD